MDNLRLEESNDVEICDYCNRKWFASEMAVWTDDSGGAVVSVPCFTNVCALATVGGEERLVCEDCYRATATQTSYFFDLHQSFAIEYFNRERYRDCLLSTIHCLRIESHHALAIESLARCLARLGKIRWARHFYQKAFGLDPADFQIRHNFRLFCKNHPEN